MAVKPNPPNGIRGSVLFTSFKLSFLSAKTRVKACTSFTKAVKGPQHLKSKKFDLNESQHENITIDFEKVKEYVSSVENGGNIFREYAKPFSLNTECYPN